MGFVAGGDLSWIEVDAKECIESRQAGGKMGEDPSVAGSDLDDPGTPTPIGHGLRDPVDDAGVVTQKRSSKRLPNES